MNLDDPNLEFIDPTPDLKTLFLHFDNIFFWGQLASRVTLRWSKRMYSRAGITYNRGNVCDIALSEPLLKLRPRKDLVETLLHAMIHAYLMVTNQDDCHGPNFQAYMNRINNASGLNMTIAHNFHEEARLYEHWWRCNGPCQTRIPHFGVVVKTVNRAPGPQDSWYERHRRSCGGTFVKIKERGQHIIIPNTGELNCPAIQGVLKNSNNIPHSPVMNNNDNINTQTNNKKRKSDNEHVDSPPSKVSKPNDEKTLVAVNVKYEINVDCPICNIKFTSSKINRHLDECLNKEVIGDLEKNNVNCPICNITFTGGEINRHLDECLNKEVIGDLENKDITNSNITIEPETSTDFEITNHTCPCCDKKVNKPIGEHLNECLAFTTIISEEGASTSTANQATIVVDDENDVFDESLTLNATGTKYPCPCCLKMVEQDEMNEHLDDCLSSYNGTSKICTLL